MNSLPAHEVVVVGPAAGFYHLGYYRADDTFFVITKFVSGDLAQATADMMKRERNQRSAAHP